MPTLVLLAAPGGGKSTVLKHLVRQQAEQRLPVRLSLSGLDWSLAPPGNEWQLAGALEFLREYVARTYRIALPPERWQRWCERGNLFFLLDGLDELDGGAAKLACGLINCLAQENARRDADNGLPLIVTCRLADFVRHRAVLDSLPVFGLAVLSEDARQAYIAAYPGLTPDSRQDLRDMIRRHPSLAQLAELPLGLALLCWLRAHEVFPEHVSRAWVYNRLLDRLLEEQRPGRPPWKWEMAAEERLGYLERAAFALFAQGTERQVEFTKAQWLAAFPAEDADKATHLLEGARQTGLILGLDTTDSRGRPQAIHSFLHLTFAEHLTASALATVMNFKGWQTPLGLPGWESKTGQAWLDEIVRQPRWTEVLLRLAGQLEEKPLIWLIEHLADPNKDNVLLLRRCLAVRCSAEAAMSVQGRLDEVIRGAQDELFYRWGWLAEKPKKIVPMKHFVHCLNAVNTMVERVLKEMPDQGGGAIRELLARKTLPVTPAVAEALVACLDSDRHCSNMAAEALGAMGPVLSTEGLSALVASFRKNGSFERHLSQHSVARSIGKFAVGGSAKALAALITLLRDSSFYHARTAILETLDHLKPINKAEVLPSVIACLKDKNGSVRMVAARSFNNISDSARGEVVAALRECLRNEPDARAEVEANEALIKLGVADRDNLVARLRERLRDDDQQIRMMAAFALGSVNAVSNAEVLEDIIPCLLDGNEHIRRAAVWALRGTDDEGKGYLRTALVSALRNRIPWFREAAAEALCDLGLADHLELKETYILLGCLTDDDGSVREAATKVLAEVAAKGEAAIVPALFMGLREEYPRIRQSAARALGKVGKIAWNAACGELLSCLKDEDWEVRVAATKALGDLSKDYRVQIVPALLACLYDRNPAVRTQAVEALGEMADGKVDTVPIFLKCLQDRDGFVRNAAAKYLGKAPDVPTDVLTALYVCLGDDGDIVRKQAAKSLERLGAPYLL